MTTHRLPVQNLLDRLQGFNITTEEYEAIIQMANLRHRPHTWTDSVVRVGSTSKTLKKPKVKKTELLQKEIDDLKEQHNDLKAKLNQLPKLLGFTWTPEMNCYLNRTEYEAHTVARVEELKKNEGTSQSQGTRCRHGS